MNTDIPFSIFPAGDDKAPLIRGWQAKASSDPHTVAQWKANGALAWGIPTGAANGLFVVDLDTDDDTGEAIGEASLLAMPRYASLLDHATVKTPSGGKHIYLKHFSGARNSQSKIGLKVDTRGEGGYVIAPGSLTTGGKYHGHCPVKLPSVPLGFRAMLLHKPPAPVSRSYDRQTPTGEVEELLAYIPADVQYGDWVEVLMALHDRYGGSGEGLAVADRWSASGSKYRKGEVTSKWDGFKRTGITWATVPAMARQYGANLSDIARRW